MDLGHVILAVVSAGALWALRRRAIRRRREIESRLEEERVFLSTVLDGIQDGIAACDADGVLTLFNRATTEMHGLPQQPIPSEHWAQRYDMYHADGRTPMRPEEVPLLRAFRGEEVANAEMVIAPTGLPRRDVLASGKVMIGPDGRRIGAVVSLHDVTESKRVEAEWRQVHHIISSSPGIVFKWRTEEGRPVEFVTGNVTQIGWKAEDFLEGGRAFASIVHEDDVERVAQEAAQHVSLGVDRFELSYRIRRRDGTVRWLDEWTVVVRDDRGEAEHFHGIIFDVTEREIIGRMLRESEQRMELVLEAADLGFWDWDVSSGRVIYSERWAGMLGYSIDDIAMSYDTWDGLLHPDDRERTLAILGEHLDGVTPTYEAEFRLRHKDGHWVWIEVRGKVLERSDDGRPVRVAGTHLDISARKEAEREARVLEDRMRQAQKLESLGLLAGGIAHDFNNILMAILGNAELARLELDAGSAARGHLREIETASSRAADLCNQMLAYSGRGGFQVRHLDLSTVVRETTAMLKACVSKKIELRLELSDDLPPVWGDETQVRQVAMNLISNAADAIADREGTITVRTSSRPVAACDDAVCTGWPDDVDACVRLEIVDDGCGMTDEVQARLFEPFFTTKVDGRGLGMAAVQGIVAGHQGDISVASAPDAGTRVVVSLPGGVAEPTSEAAPAHAAAAADGARGCILLVDDEETVLTLGARLLESLGWTVRTAADGLEAVTAVEEDGDGLSVVLMDVTMPRLDGIEALERIREQRPALPVVLTSGYRGSDIAERVGPDALFIQKPFHRDDLAAVLDAAAAQPAHS